MSFEEAKKIMNVYRKEKAQLIAKYTPIYEEMINKPLKAELKVLHEKLEKDLAGAKSEEAMEA